MEANIENSLPTVEPRLPTLSKIFNTLINGANTIGCIALGLMVLPIVADVTVRLVAHKSIQGVIDIQEFAMVFIVFLALASVQNSKAHIRIDLLTSRLPKWLQDVLDSFVYLCTTLLFVVITWQLIMQVSVKQNSLSQSLKIPISIFMVIAAIGLCIFVIVIARDFVQAAGKTVQAGKWPYLIPVVAVSSLVVILPAILGSISMNMGGLQLGGLGMLCLITLMLLGTPIGIAMALVGYVGMLITSNSIAASFSMVGFTPYSTTASFTYAVIPMFILMGEIALYSGISRDLFDAASKWMGRLPGGLAIAGVSGCTGFAAVCGDSMATAVTMGSVTLPELKKHKYDDSLATGALAAGGTLGILIPPSIGFIFYALITEESIGKLFIAGIIPGLLLASLFIGTIYFIARRHPERAPRAETYSMSEKMKSLKGVIPMAILIVFVLGGMLAGLFSPTEAGAVGAFGAFVLAIVRRRLPWEGLKKAIAETTSVTCMLFLILIGVSIIGYFLAATRLPMLLAGVISSLAINRWLIFLIVCILYVILGCLMNVVPMILLTLPSLYPSIFALGFDPIWFGVVMVILMEMGQISPPVGINVYAISSVAKGVPMEKIFKGIVPFFICMAVCILLLCLFPQIALILPNLLI